MFYDRFKSLCEMKGISPTRASILIGFSKGSVAYWKKKMEAGEDVMPDSRVAEKIADFFNVSTDYLLGREEEEDLARLDGEGYYLDPETAKVAQELFDDPDLRVLFDAARDSKPEHLQLAADILRKFKETNPDG